MNNSIKENSHQSGSLGLWLVLATSIILLALCFSWMLSATTPTYQSSQSTLSFEQPYPPAKELKLLAASVVSRRPERLQAVSINEQQPAAKKVDSAARSVKSPLSPHAGLTPLPIAEVAVSHSDIESHTIATNNIDTSVQSGTTDSLELESTPIQFLVGSKAISEQLNLTLSNIADVLSRNDDSFVSITVATNESGNFEQDLRLSQERGRAIIARLVSQGNDFSRFSLNTPKMTNLPLMSHTVNIETKPSAN